MAATFAILTCTVLALSFSSTRGIGILGTGVLILLFPVVATVAFIVGCIAAYFIHRYKKELEND
jgi:hypothetical protein